MLLFSGKTKCGDIIPGTMNFEADVRITGRCDEKVERLLSAVLSDFHYSLGYCSETFKVRYTSEPWMRIGVNNP
jgi:hypothetical protein